MERKTGVSIIKYKGVQVLIHRSNLMTQLREHKNSPKSIMIRCPLDTTDSQIIEYLKKNYSNIVNTLSAGSNDTGRKRPQSKHSFLTKSAYFKERNNLYREIKKIYKNGTDPHKIENAIMKLKQNTVFYKNEEYIDIISKRFAAYEQQRLERIVQNEHTHINPEIRDIFREVANPNGQAFDKTAYIRKFSTKLIYIAKK